MRNQGHVFPAGGMRRAVSSTSERVREQPSVLPASVEACRPDNPEASNGVCLMEIKFVIPGRLPGLNDYVRACRSGYHAGNTMKQAAEKKILGAMLEARVPRLRAKERVFLRLTWVEPNTRRDMDNVAFAKKFVLDAIKKYGLIADDGQKYIAGFSDSFCVDKNNPRIEVEILEVLDEKL